MKENISGAKKMGMASNMIKRAKFYIKVNSEMEKDKDGAETNNMKGNLGKMTMMDGGDM
jgi:hypothetical protein